MYYTLIECISDYSAIPSDYSAIPSDYSNENSPLSSRKVFETYIYYNILVITESSYRKSPCYFVLFLFLYIVHGDLIPNNKFVKS